MMGDAALAGRGVNVELDCADCSGQLVSHSRLWVSRPRPPGPFVFVPGAVRRQGRRRPPLPEHSLSGQSWPVGSSISGQAPWRPSHTAYEPTLERSRSVLYRGYQFIFVCRPCQPNGGDSAPQVRIRRNRARSTRVVETRVTRAPELGRCQDGRERRRELT